MINLIKKWIEVLERFAYINRLKDWATSPVIGIPSVEEIQENDQLVNKRILTSVKIRPITIGYESVKYGERKWKFGYDDLIGQQNFLQVGNATPKYI